ncbi:MAG: dihydroneopterin aldolase [Bacteroidales bacterium]|nr:dihydroneopterin aldolase [Bacteroidales bacterium]
MSKIKIEGMQFYAYHGCFSAENIVGTHFSVDCSLVVDTAEAAMTDDLEKTVNYQAVYLLIAKEMEQPSALLEHVAYRILKRLHDCFPLIEKGWVSVQKHNPPLGGKITKVAVEMSSEDIKNLI